MRILFHKLRDDRHAMEIVRDDGARERVECETRSYLEHDLLHYAVEAEAHLDDGFWGSLARGTTLAAMNDRTAPGYATAEGMMIEQVVGVLSGLMKGRTPPELVAGFARYAAALGQTPPPWLTVPFVEAVQARLRRLLGHWRATPFHHTMELCWPPAASE
jgi:hypothetical protein